MITLIKLPLFNDYINFFSATTYIMKSQIHIFNSSCYITWDGEYT